MPSPKDPKAFAAYCKKMSKIAKAKGYGKWMKGRKVSEKTLAKMRAVQSAIGNTPEEKKRRSDRAKTLGYGKWMKGRPANQKTIEYAKSRKGKTYKEIYGPDRAKKEKKKRRDGNRKRWEGTEKQPQRDKHNSDQRYIRWRTRVFKNDNYTCQKCGIRGGYLEAHHVKQWALFPELRYKASNGETYCKPCHKWMDRHTNEK